MSKQKKFSDDIKLPICLPTGGIHCEHKAQKVCRLAGCKVVGFRRICHRTFCTKIQLFFQTRNSSRSGCSRGKTNQSNSSLNPDYKKRKNNLNFSHSSDIPNRLNRWKVSNKNYRVWSRWNFWKIILATVRDHNFYLEMSDRINMNLNPSLNRTNHRRHFLSVYLPTYHSKIISSFAKVNRKWKDIPNWIGILLNSEVRLLNCVHRLISNGKIFEAAKNLNSNRVATYLVALSRFPNIWIVH